MAAGTSDMDANTASVDADEWTYLFDGTTTEGWRAYNGESLPPQWVIEDRTLTFDTEKRTEG